MCALVAACAAATSCNVTVSNTALRRTRSGARVVAQDGNIANARDVDGAFVLLGMSYGDCVYAGCANESAGACGFDGGAARFLVWTSPTLADGSWSEPRELLPAATRPPEAAGAIFFRPHLVFNARTREWVLWVRWLPPRAPTLAGDPTLYLVAAAPSLDGPFTVRNANVSMFYENSADDNLFVDDGAGGDGAAYIVHTARSTGTRIVVERLTPDFYASAGATDAGARSELIGAGHSEAPAMWAARGRYYVSFSPLCCYCAEGSATSVWSSRAPLGPYAPAGALGNAPRAQQNFVFSDAALGATLWAGSRWGSDPLAPARPLFDNSLQFWAPLAYDADGAVLTLAWADASTFAVRVPGACAAPAG